MMELALLPETEWARATQTVLHTRRLPEHLPHRGQARQVSRVPETCSRLQVGPEMLKDIDIHWVILGHSERRHIIGESDAHIGEKIKQAITSGLKVIACIGETEKERDAGQVRSYSSWHWRLACCPAAHPPPPPPPSNPPSPPPS